MKINEVTQPSDKALFESFDKDNDTGFATEDLVKIFRTHEANNWEETTFEDELEHLTMLEEMDNAAAK